MKNLNNLMDHILYHISRLFSIKSKKHGQKTVNPSIKIYTNKTENRITFKIKSEYYIERVTLETMKLLESTKSKMAKGEKGENVSYL